MRLDSRPQFDHSTIEPTSDLHAFLIDHMISITPLGFEMIARDNDGQPVTFHF